MATKKFLIPVVFIAVVLSMFTIASATPSFNPDYGIFPTSTGAPPSINTLSFQLSVNVTDVSGTQDITNVWYYFSDTAGSSLSANTSMANVTTQLGVGTTVFNASVSLNFTSAFTSPGWHYVTFCANDTNITCATYLPFIVKVANITQITDYVGTLNATLNITYENGTNVGNNIMDPVNYNYTLRVNTTATTFVEVVGMQINETLMQQISNSANINTTLSIAARNAIISVGYNATSFLWYDASSYLPNASFYKYGRIQLPNRYPAVFYCNGTASSPTCFSLTACSNIVNLTSYSTLLAGGACYNATEISGKTVIYVPQFSGAAGGNDTVAPGITVSVPASNYANYTNFTVSIAVTDATGINVSRVYYRLENATGGNTSWYAMTNTTNSTTSTSFGAAYNITSNPDGNYTFRFNVSDTLGNVNTTVTSTKVILDDTAPVITAFSLSPTSITAGASAPTSTCIATDNSDSFGGNATTAVSGISTGSTGTHNATCVATDTAGNTATNRTSYTITAASTTPGSSSNPTTLSGTTPSVTTSTVTLSEVKAGEVTKVTGFAKTPITEIDLEVKTTTTNVRFAIQKFTSKPAEVTVAPGTLFSYMDIAVTGLATTNIKSAKIKFTVSRNWLTTNSMDKTGVSLYRYSGGLWSKLATAISSEDDFDVFYAADTPAGFSTFAIVGEKAAAATTTTTTTQETTTPGTTTAAKTGGAFQPKPSTGLGIFLLLIAVALGIYKYSKRRPRNFPVKRKGWWPF